MVNWKGYVWEEVVETNFKILAQNFLERKRKTTKSTPKDT
jgi:hypothetical protein